MQRFQRKMREEPTALDLVEGTRLGRIRIIRWEGAAPQGQSRKNIESDQSFCRKRP